MLSLFLTEEKMVAGAKTSIKLCKNSDRSRRRLSRKKAPKGVTIDFVHRLPFFGFGFPLRAAFSFFREMFMSGQR